MDDSIRAQDVYSVGLSLWQQCRINLCIAGFVASKVFFPPRKQSLGRVRPPTAVRFTRSPPAVIVEGDISRHWPF